jgi:hypothetical protein
MYRKVDAFELMSYSNADGGIELDMWYRLLDCGFRIPPCAGTDAAVNRFEDPPMGGFRTYAKCGQSAPRLYDWLDAVASGRTFVTNGPLFRKFRVNGAWEPGDGFSLGVGQHRFFAEVDVECSVPMDRVEIIVNGRIEDTLVPGVDPCRIEGISYFYLDESSWIAARATGPAQDWFTIGAELFAHTGAVYSSIQGESVLSGDAALYFAEWIDSLIGLAHDKGEWGSPEDSTRVLSELAVARDWYSAMAGLSTGMEQPGPGDVPPAACVTVHPNPFSSAARIRFEVRSANKDSGTIEGIRRSYQGEVGEVEIYDVAGRIVRRLKASSSAAGRLEVEWDGTTGNGMDAASGIYFCRVRSGGYTADAKILLIR